MLARGRTFFSASTRGKCSVPACSAVAIHFTGKGKEELSAIKKEITGATRYIKSYEGPSRIWFSYQNSLSEGCNRLSKIVSELPVSEQTAKLLVDTLLRLDNKLCRGGVDDSDGAVGGFIEETVQVFKEYAKFDPLCVKAFQELKGKATCFGWERTAFACPPKPLTAYNAQAGRRRRGTR